jgi:hypothetical protein
LIQNSDTTNNTPSAAENRKRIANHHAKRESALKAISDAVTTATAAQSSGSTPKRAASRGTKGTAIRLATPATAVLAPIIAVEMPIRFISRESRGIVRLIPIPTIAHAADGCGERGPPRPLGVPRRHRLR